MIKFHSIFCQMLNLFSRYEFQKAVNQHKAERHARGISCWDQFVAMLFCHLAKTKSLPEIIGGMASQEPLLYHLGTKLMKRSSLAYANAHRPWQTYQEVFYQLLRRCPALQQGHRVRFKNKLLSIDASVIDLCATVFDWAKFRKTPSIKTAGRSKYCFATSSSICESRPLSGLRQMHCIRKFGQH